MIFRRQIHARISPVGGEPCCRGPRPPVESIPEWFGSGMTTDEILADDEDLERDDLMAVLEFAARPS